MDFPLDDSAHQLVAGKLPGALLQRLIEQYVDADDSVVIGPEVGADAAAIRIASPLMIVKSDPITFPTPNVARYLVNVNANDVACMGGIPRWMLVTALLPAGDTTASDVEQIFRELSAACKDLGIVLVGGHTEITESVRSPVLVGMLVGESDDSRLLDLRRSEPGDELLLCNSVAIEGTAILANEAPAEALSGIDDLILDQARDLTNTPGISVVEAAERLIDSGVVVRGMHDPTEGGIATALWETARVTGCSIELVREIPIRDDTSEICDALGLDPLGLIASGALLSVVRSGDASTAIQSLRQVGIECTLLGVLSESGNGEPAVTLAGGDPLPTFETDEIARYFSST